MRIRATLAAVVAALILAVSCSAEDPATETDAPSEVTKQGAGPVERTEPVTTPDPPADPLAEEASDAGLTAEYDDCTGGDGDACDTLFLLSPAGSELEAYADSCGGREAPGAWCGELMGGLQETVPGLDERELFRDAMELTFETQPESSALLCDAVDLYGMDFAVTNLRRGFGESGFHEDIAVEILTERC